MRVRPFGLGSTLLLVLFTPWPACSFTRHLAFPVGDVCHPRVEHCAAVMGSRWLVVRSAADDNDQLDDQATEDITTEFFNIVRDRMGEEYATQASEPDFPADELTKEFFDVVQNRSGTGGNPGDPSSTLSDQKIWDELSKRAGFARVSKMLTQAIQNRKEAKGILKDAIRSVPGVMEETAGRNVDDIEEGTSVLLPEERENMAPTDVILAVLDSLQENDTPSPNHGIEFLLSFMSSASSFGAVAEKDKFVEYITESNYSLLLFWDQIAFAGKLEVSLDGTKAYQTVRLRDGRTYGWGKVKWTLSKQDDKGGWCIDTMIVQAKTT